MNDRVDSNNLDNVLDKIVHVAIRLSHKDSQSMRIRVHLEAAERVVETECGKA